MVALCRIHFLPIFLSMIYRDCKWLPDELKEDSVLHAKLVEKSLIRAVFYTSL